MYSGIMHWNGGSFQMEGINIESPEDLPRDWLLNRQYFYLTSTLAKQPLAKIVNYAMDYGDKVFGDRPGDFVGISYLLRNPAGEDSNDGNYIVYHPKLMNLKEEDQSVPTLLNHALENKIATFLTHDIERVSCSIAKTSIRTFNSEYNGEYYYKLHDRFGKDKFECGMNVEEMSIYEILDYADRLNIDIPDVLVSAEDLVNCLNALNSKAVSMNVAYHRQLQMLQDDPDMQMDPIGKIGDDLKNKITSFVAELEGRIEEEGAVSIMEELSKKPFQEEALTNIKNNYFESVRTYIVEFLFERKFNPPLGLLPSRFREMAHAAVHGGPIACMRGGSKDAVEVDITGAYLNAMCGEIPVIGSYQHPETDEWIHNNYRALPKHIRWDQIMARGIEHGFIDATVHVSEDLKYGLPPLPLTTDFGMSFPRGKFRGCWTIPLLKMAVEMGEVKVLTVHHAFYPERTEKVFLPYASYLRTLPKHISKELYVKFWGKFNFNGGFVGVKLENPPEYPAIPKDGLWWHEEKIPQLSRNVTPAYRPDIAAYISSYNHMALYKASRTLKPESIVAVHVDAIWTDDIEGAERLCNQSPKIKKFDAESGEYKYVSDYGGWAIKRRGPLRFWACGVYSHAGKVGYSGLDPRVHASNGKKPTHDEVETWIQMRSIDSESQRNETEVSRDWIDGIVPAKDPLARSKSILLNQSNPKCPFGGIDFWSTIWNFAGWGPREETEESEEESEESSN